MLISSTLFTLLKKRGNRGKKGEKKGGEEQGMQKSQDR